MTAGWRLGCFVAMVLGGAACDSDEKPAEEEVVLGTAALGETCRGNPHCAPVAGRVVKCRCTDEADEPICVALQHAGESCAITGSFQLGCEPGSVCVAALDGGEPLCQAEAQLGEECGVCESSLTCSEGLCSVGTGSLGSDCFDDVDCAPEYRCEFLEGCVERLPLGAPCGGMASAKTCVEGAVCDITSTGVCVPAKADGERCSVDFECATGECSLIGCGADDMLSSNQHLGCGGL